MNYQKIYRDYVMARAVAERVGQKTPSGKVAKNHNISRTTLYTIVNRVESLGGYDVEKQARIDRKKYLWETRFALRFDTVSIFRTKKKRGLLIGEIARDMKACGFSVSEIAHLLQRDRSTIIHHLKA